MKRVLQCWAVLSVVILSAQFAYMTEQKKEIDELGSRLDFITEEIREVENVIDYPVHEHTRASEVSNIDTEEQIAEEIRLGEMELIAQLVEAEAGNQDLYGKRLVADTVLNRSEMWDMSIEDTIFYPNAFSSIDDGNFDKAAWHISDDSFKASRMEYEADNIECRADSKVIYFRTGRYSVYGKPAYKYGAQYFSYED
jgi:hypothetical protein